MRKLISLLIILLLSARITAQSDSTEVVPIDIFVIDSYITPELPRKLIVSFATSDSCTSKLDLQKNKIYTVSNQPSDNHKIEIDLSDVKIDSLYISYRIIVINRTGKESSSDEYLVDLPKELISSSESSAGMFQMCLGGLVFAIPSITYIAMNGEHYWSLGKEIPLLSFYSEGYNYPEGYLSLEYNHILKSDKKNFLRGGYKHIFQVQHINYVSPGISFFGDFKGYNGLSAELSAGLFQIKNVFTFYVRYRYNFHPKNSGQDFHEFSIGLYSNFFSFNF